MIHVKTWKKKSIIYRSDNSDEIAFEIKTIDVEVEIIAIADIDITVEISCLYEYDRIYEQ